MLQSRFFRTGVSCGPLTRSVGLISKRRGCFSAKRLVVHSLRAAISCQVRPVCSMEPARAYCPLSVKNTGPNVSCMPSISGFKATNVASP